MKKQLFLLFACFMSLQSFVSKAQQQTIGGRVVDGTSNEPLPGVNIGVKGTSRGTATDIDGNFSLQAAAGDVLIVSYLGYLSKEVPVGNQTNLTITLAEDRVTLDQVVVTGYQTERKKDLTGAVSVVDVEDMNRQAVANPIKGLQGRVAGMYITGNGSPSAPATVRIRGIGTLNNNDPLYIIDGVPTKAGMHELNPADIESLQVLKDASATSIYGSRAANGVIIITTRRGKTGKTQINANAYTSISSFTTRTRMLDTEGYGKALWQANINNESDPNTNSVQYMFDWGVDPQSGRPVLNKVLVPEYLDANRTMKSSNTDWFDEISRTGVIQNYDVSLSNGTENGSYLLSIGYFDNKGVIKTSEFNRLSARLNSDYKFFNGKVTVGQNLSLTKSSEVGAGPMNEAMQALPIIPVRTVDGLGWGGPVGGMNDRQNPVRLLEDNKQNNYDFMRVFGNFFADVNLYKGLTFRSNFGVDYSNYTHRRYRKAYQSGYLNNPVNRLESNQSHSVKTTWSNTLNYSLVTGKHRLDAVVGTELFQDNENIFWASRENFVLEDDAFMYLDAGTGIKDNGGRGAKHVLLSYFGKANYSFADKYLVSATLRYDGSSRFGQNNRFGTFPAFSAGWRLSEESFIKDNITFFDDLKLRFGWGMTGNQEIDNNAIYNLYLTDYAGTSYDINGNKSGVLPSGFKLVQNANPNLRWEASTMSNLGLDFEILNQKLYGSAEAYIRKTSDILLLPPYIGTLGEGGNQWVNGASMQNKGLELTLGNRTQIGDLFLDLNANFDMYRNKITHLPSEVVNAYGGDGRGQNILGRPRNSFFGYVADGLFRTEEEVDGHAAQPGKGLGRIRYKDLNDDGIVDDYDRTWIGTPHPDFTYGFNASARYKAFDFNIFLQGVSGIDVVNDFKYATDFWSVSETGSNKGARLLDAWSPSNPNSDIPMISLVDNNFESRFSTYFIEKGSYLKLRNAQLGYTLPTQLTSKVGLQSLRVYVGGDNLGILLKSKTFTGIDPESPGFGYPNPLVLTTGVNIRL
ncbi:SusC/RagA family TonB-linked outer membrane protein [Pontibacter beigongshangensis]|uniref:SusC/RagA family TonB-linked outer membrane protein n=1 Tax=Pontibacter beigongshangensis TaxID=2574733 RepID=UPI00164F3845|nr:TonB-dependent receptor [Pontibacter beigongshangensis]